MKLSSIYKTLQKEFRPIFFLSPILSRTLGLEKIIPNFHIITISKDPLIELLRKNNISILCLEEVCKINKSFRNSFELLSHPEVEKFIKEKSNKLTPNILTFKSLPQIKNLCKNKKYNYLQSDPLIVRDLEDKVLFQKLLESEKITTIPSQIKTLETCEFSNKPMVLQLRRGFAGNSTFLIKNKKKFKEFQKTYSRHKVKLSTFIKGKTITINACLCETEVKIGAIFRQIDNIIELNTNPFGTSGNSHFLNEEIDLKVKTKILQIVDKITQVIYKKGFRGFFGLDLIITTTGNVYPIECNPRLTASVGNFTQMEIHLKKVPLLLFHILTFLNYKIPVEKKCILEDLKYSFLIFRNTSRGKITVNSELKAGIYNYNLEFQKQSIDFINCTKDEFLLLPAKNNTVISENKEYLYLLSTKKLFNNEKLNPEIIKIIKKIKKNSYKSIMN